MTDTHTTDIMPGEPDPLGLDENEALADALNRAMVLMQEHRDTVIARLNSARAMRDRLNADIKALVAALEKADRILRADAPRKARKPRQVTK